MSPRLRVASYNLRGLKDDAASAVSVVRAIAPDVLLLQEVPRHPLSGWRIARFARHCDLVWSGRTRRLSGTSLMTSSRVVATGAVDHKLPVAPRANPRSYTAAQVHLPGGQDVTVVSVHLSLLEDERVRHASQILTDLVGESALAEEPELADGPFVVGGDLNETVDGRAWRLLGERLVLATPEAPTFPAARPHRWIDAIFAGSSLTVLPHAAVELDPTVLTAASDHLPVWVDLEVG